MGKRRILQPTNVGSKGSCFSPQCLFEWLGGLLNLHIIILTIDGNG